MRKLYVMVIFVITMVLGSSTVFAGPDDIVHDKGFNNLYWGQTIEQVAQNYDIDFNDYEVDGIYTKYKIHKDFLYVYNVKAIPTIELYFYHDKLAKMKMVFITTNDSENRDNIKTMKRALSNSFGDPTIWNRYYSETKNRLHLTEWTRTDTLIKMIFSYIKQNGRYILVLDLEDGSLR